MGKGTEAERRPARRSRMPEHERRHDQAETTPRVDRRERAATLRGRLAGRPARADRALSAPSRSPLVSSHSRGAGPQGAGARLGKPDRDRRQQHDPGGPAAPGGGLPGALSSTEPAIHRAAAVATGIPAAPAPRRSTVGRGIPQALSAVDVRRRGTWPFVFEQPCAAVRVPRHSGLRDPERAGPRRHGRGLQGSAAQSEARGGAEDDPGGRPFLGRGPGPLPRRSGGRGPLAAPEHRADPCHRRTGRPALLRVGTGGRRQPGAAAGREARAARARGRPGRDPGPGHALRAPARDRASRSEAGQHSPGERGRVSAPRSSSRR